MEPVSNQKPNVNPYTPSEGNLTNQPQSPVSVNNRRKFSVIESVFAWMCLLFGYIFCRVFPLSESPFGGLVFTLLLYISGFIVLMIMKQKLKLMSVVIALTAILISFSLILTSNNFLHFFSYCYSLATFGYFIFSAFGNTARKGFSDLIIADFFKALIIMPFCSFGYMFTAMFSSKKKGRGKIFLKIIVGVAITFIPTLIVFSLLSYDSDFTNLFNNIFDFDFSDFWAHLGSLILGIPIGLYFYGLFISSVDKKCKNILTAESSKKALKNMRIAPAVTIIAAVIPLLFLYAVFFISQWKYYISGFTGTLPQNFSYADYAREGFFQLCIVAVINLIVIIAVVLFLKRDNKANRIILKSIVLVFSASTLILISTAVAKMVMYIETYGLTPKRVYSTWFMLLIALVFILLSLKLFIKKLKVVAVSFALAVTMFALIALPNVDAFIARYNIERYINGTLSTVDLDAMKDLGTSAIPALIDLDKYLDDKEQSAEEIILNDDIYDYFIKTSNYFKQSDKNIFSYTIPDKVAEKALKEIGY